MSFIDIHCHLDLCSNLPSIIGRGRTANISIILTQGVNAESNRKSLEFSARYKEVRAATGLYPIDAISMSDADVDKELQFIREHRKEIAAIGEVGMDFKEDEKQHDRQKYIFNKLILLAQELDKPLIVHSRKAEKECIELLENSRTKKVIMHCFCGAWKLVERIQRNGWFLSIPTNVTYAQQFQQIAKALPLTALFCETDSPFLHPGKERNNEPALVVESYKTIAMLKGLEIGDVAAAIARNYEKLFGK